MRGIHTHTSLFINYYYIEISDHQSFHGDGVKDIAFTVENCRDLYKVIIINNY